MTLPVLFSLALLVAGSAASWISVPLPSGAWVAVREASRRRFLLHPRALAQRVSVPSCSSGSPTVIDVRFWRSHDLRLTERALRNRQLGEATAASSVEPYQARRVALFDQRGLWRPLRPYRVLPVSLPPVMRFALRRTKNDSCSAPSLRDLAGLVIEMRGGAGRFRENDVAVELDLSLLARTNKTGVEWKANATSDQMRVPDEVRRLQDEVNQQQNEVRRLQSLLTKAGEGRKPLPPLKRSPDGIANISDCQDVMFRGLKGGIYYLEPLARKVRCTQRGEMVVLVRESNALDFDRPWMDYKKGFGDCESDFFLGLDAMNRYTFRGDKCMSLTLRLMKDSLPLEKIQLSRFTVGPESSRFPINYERYEGSMISNVFEYVKGRPFTTKDRPDPSNCVTRYVTANWFKQCYQISLFGRYNYTKNSVDGFSTKRIKKSQPDHFFRLHSAFMTLRKVGGDPQSLQTQIDVSARRCPARVSDAEVPETGLYVITIGGGSGGRAPHYNSPSGGRGALVTAHVLLAKGTKLRFVVGCAGGVGYLSGAGGDGTFLVDVTRRALLAVAGGGGGGGWISGGDGLGGEKPGKARLAPEVTQDVLTVPAAGWDSIKPKIFGAHNTVASSGGLTSSDQAPEGRGGGGGGGYKGGWTASDGAHRGEKDKAKHSAGGGGSSYCNEALAESCRKKTGGNNKSHGFLRIEAYTCF